MLGVLRPGRGWTGAAECRAARERLNGRAASGQFLRRRERRRYIRRRQVAPGARKYYYLPASSILNQDGSTRSMELLKKGPTFWLVIKIKLLKLKLKSISDVVIHQGLMYSRCYFVMKRFNSSPLARLVSQVLVSCRETDDWAARWLPQSQTSSFYVLSFIIPSTYQFSAPHLRLRLPLPRCSVAQMAGSKVCCSSPSSISGAGGDASAD